jgi:hypothetical protein
MVADRESSVGEKATGKTSLEPACERLAEESHGEKQSSVLWVRGK